MWQYEFSIINIGSQYPRNNQTPQIFIKGCSKIVLDRLLLDRFIGNTQYIFCTFNTDHRTLVYARLYSSFPTLTRIC